MSLLKALNYEEKDRMIVNTSSSCFARVHS